MVEEISLWLAIAYFAMCQSCVCSGEVKTPQVSLLIVDGSNLDSRSWARYLVSLEFEFRYRIIAYR